MPSQEASTQNELVYKQLPNAEIDILLHELDEKIRDFIRITMPNDDSANYDDNVQYTVCVLDFIDIILRVDKRKHYFKVFHDMDCNEVKIAALYAYWIAKLRPIMITDPRYKEVDGYNNKINELFAIHLMISASNGMDRVKLDDGPCGLHLQLNNPFIKRLWYSFRFRNITIDSIIVLADAITTDTFKLSDQEVKP